MADLEASWGCFFKEKTKKSIILSALMAFFMENLVAWVVFNDFTSQSILVYVGVNFSGSDAFMP